MSKKTSSFFSNLIEGIKESVGEVLEEIVEDESKEKPESSEKADNRDDNVVSDSKADSRREKTIDAISVFLNGVSKALEKTGVAINVVTEKAGEVVKVASAEGAAAPTLMRAENRVGSLILKGATLCRCEGDDAFVIVPEGVTRIDQGAFENNVNLKSVQLPDSVRVISKGAFKNCTSLSVVRFSKNLEFIGESAFEGCSLLNGENIQEADLPESMRASEKLDVCPEKLLVLPESLIHVGKAAFKGCVSLEHIYLPGRIKRLYQEVFWGCEKLATVFWKCADKSASNLIGRGAFRISGDYMSLDYYDWNGDVIRRVHPDEEAFAEAYPYITCVESPAVQCILRSTVRDICEQNMFEDVRSRDLTLLNRILRLADIISDGDPYAYVDAVMHLRAFILALPMEDVLSENLIMQVVYMHTMLSIGGNGTTYREHDALWRLRMKTDYDGMLCEIVRKCLIEQNPPDENALSEEEAEDFLRELEQNEADETNAIHEADSDEDDSEVEEVDQNEVVQAFQQDVSQASAKNAHVDRISIDGQVFVIDDMLLWIGFINLLGGVVNTNRYNPRIWHHTGWLDKSGSYWEFVDVIEGLIRGAGYEKTRYSPENVYEEDGVTRWCAAWSRALHEAEIDLGIIQIRYARASDGDNYRDLFILLDRKRATKFRALFDEFGSGDNICAWFNGVDIFMFRTV